MTQAAIELIGPKGYTHGFVYHGAGSGRARTSRLVSRDVRAAQGKLKNASPTLVANRATAALRGRRGSEYQHLAAARLHASAAKQTSGAMAARHQQLAKMHRGIAGRTPGKMTGSRPGPKQGKFKNPIGPGMGTLGKGATQSHTLPRGDAALTKEGRAKAYAAGHALPPPSPGSPHGFPVTSPRSWEKARAAVGRAGSPARRAQLQALLRRTAAQYGKTAALKKSWAAANDQQGIELAAWEHELRGRGGKWVASNPGQADFPASHQMHVDALRDHLINFHGGAPRPKAVRGTSKTARGKAALVAQHELMHRMLAGERIPGNIVNQGIDHSHGQSVSYANTGPALEFTVPNTPALPVSGPLDLLISRDPGDGSAVVRHRRGGAEIGRIRHSDDGQWRATRDGKDLGPHTRQRGALLELIGTHNRSASSPYHRAAPDKPEKTASSLAEVLGIPQLDVAAASELANTAPVAGTSDGPRVTGLSQGGDKIYKQLRKRGFPHARAHAFASRAQRRTGGFK